MKYIFLDRDGTITVDHGYVFKLDDLEFIPGVIEALRRLNKLGYKLIIVTNQSGIGRGYFSEKDFLKFNDFFIKKLKEVGVVIEFIFYCPHNIDEGCVCRKPQLGMLKSFIKNNRFHREKSFVVGDKTSDIRFGNNLGVKTCLVKTGERGSDRLYDVSPDYVCKDLLTFVDLIKG